MNLQALFNSIVSMSNNMAAPAKSILIVLIQIVVQVLQYIVYLLNLLLSKI
jgi:hypothetical protein